MRHSDVCNKNTQLGELFWFQSTTNRVFATNNRRWLYFQGYAIMHHFQNLSLRIIQVLRDLVRVITQCWMKSLDCMNFILLLQNHLCHHLHLVYEKVIFTLIMHQPIFSFDLGCSIEQSCLFFCLVIFWIFAWPAIVLFYFSCFWFVEIFILIFS